MRNGFVLPAAALVLSLTAAPALADVKMVLVGPMTGQFATFWDQLQRGAATAVAEVNAAGGIGGQKLVLDTADDACDPRQAVTVANQTVSKGYNAVIGHFCSGTSVAVSEVYAQENLVMISPGSVNSLLTERGMTNIFRTCGRDDQQAEVATRAIVQRKLGERIAIVHDKSTYGRGLADQVKTRLNAAGVKEALYDSISPGERDFSALLTKLKTGRVDLVYYGGYHTEAGLMVRQAREQGLNARFMSGDALKTSEFATIAGSSSDGFLFTFFPDPRNNPDAAPAVQAIKTAGFEPEGFTLYAYAAVQVYADAARRAGSVDAKKVSDAIRAKPIKTVLGELAFNAKGDPDQNRYQVYAWNGGKFAPSAD